MTATARTEAQAPEPRAAASLAAPAPASSSLPAEPRTLARVLRARRAASPSRAHAVTLQRCAGCGGHAPGGGKCAACAAKEQEEEFAPELDALRRAVVARRALARACLPAAECAAPQASLSTFVQQTESKPENQSKAAKRQADCAAGKAECRSDGHAATATALTAFLKDRNPTRLDHVSGIFVNKDMPADYGAVTVDCATFTPPLPVTGGKKYCTTVPDAMEAEAKLYMNTATKIIGGVPRYTWVTRTLLTLVHETEHGRFDTAADDPAKTPLKGPATGSCKPADVESDLSELAAQMAEFPIILRRLQPFGKDVQDKRMAAWFKYHIDGGGEDVTGTLKALRCKCDCADVDSYVKQVVAFETAGWNSYEKTVYHSEMKKPEHKLNWPVDPPAAVDVADLPSATPNVDVKDLADYSAMTKP